MGLKQPRKKDAKEWGFTHMLFKFNNGFWTCLKVTANQKDRGPWERDCCLRSVSFRVLHRSNNSYLYLPQITSSYDSFPRCHGHAIVTASFCLPRVTYFSRPTSITSFLDYICYGLHIFSSSIDFFFFNHCSDWLWLISFDWSPTIQWAIDACRVNVLPESTYCTYSWIPLFET